MTVFNPFDYLGSEAAKIVADGWTAVMVSFWSAGLWVLKFVLTIVDAFMTPDISQGGPAAEVYRFTFWMGVALLSVLVMVQLGVAAVKRNGESLARLLIGVGQFVVVWAGWLTYAGVVIAGAGGLTTALLQTLLGVDTWAAWQPTQAFSTEDITDGTLATVLGFMGLFLWLASIGHFIVMLARAAALMVLVATAPISAGGAQHRSRAAMVLEKSAVVSRRSVLARADGAGTRHWRADHDRGRDRPSRRVVHDGRDRDPGGLPDLYWVFCAVGAVQAARVR